MLRVLRIENLAVVAYAQDLGLPDFERLAYKYDVMELSTALKPTFLKRMMAEGFERVVYLDPDIELSSEDVADIGAKDPSDIDVFTMVVLDKDPAQRRTNLRAPILVCRTTRKAKQVVLQDTRLPIKFYLRDLKPTGR